MLLFRNGSEKLFILFLVSGIAAVIADHFEVLFRDMLYQPTDKLKSRNFFCDKNIVLMAVIVESDEFSVIVINA